MSEPHAPPAFQPIQSAPAPPPPPRRSGPAWLAGALAVLGTVLVGVVAGVLLFGDAAPLGAGPSPTPVAGATPSPTPTPRPSPIATPTDTPTASPGPVSTPSPTATSPASPEPGASPDVAGEIDRVVASVPQLRDLEPLRDVPYDFVSREEFQADLQDLIDEETDPELLAAEERLLKRLGLLPDDIDLRDALLDLYGTGVAAFYRPDTGTFYIIGEGSTFGPFDRMVVAHEYTHALQDQHFDLEGRRITDPSEGDAALAQSAAIEGDATLVMVQWAYQNMSPAELMGLEDAVSPSDQELLESMPLILRRQALFPYEDGLLFTIELFSQSLGWDAINESIEEPPASTEQILHPEKYIAREAPVLVPVPDLGDALGDDWERTYEQTMGELNTQLWVGAGEEPAETLPGLPPVWPQAEVAAGWGGDRLAMYETPDGDWALVWELAWDTQEDADEFAARAGELQDTLDGPSQIVTRSPDDGSGVRRVLVVAAHDEATLERLTVFFEE